MNDSLPQHLASLPGEKLLEQCEVRRLRRSGPGGQHRNKVETAILLIHDLSGVKAEASERRSQAENLSVALFRLRVNLALELRQPRDRNTGPSDLWQSRVVQGKIRVNSSHDDFPALLAEALDLLDALQADVKSAAEYLNVTVSQLLKFLQQEARAFQLVNRWREERHLHRLHGQ